MAERTGSAPMGVSKIQKRIRDNERLLRKPGLAATKKVNAERAIAALKVELRDSVKVNQAKKIGRKYHMVRFFERQKAVRQLKKADASDKQLAAFYYTHEFPASEKYCSIYATKGEPAGLVHPFMKKIEQEMADKTRPSGPEGRIKALEIAKVTLQKDRDQQISETTSKSK